MYSSDESTPPEYKKKFMDVMNSTGKIVKEKTLMAPAEAVEVIKNSTTGVKESLTGATKAITESLTGATGFMGEVSAFGRKKMKLIWIVLVVCSLFYTVDFLLKSAVSICSNAEKLADIYDRIKSRME
jgi:hypothetical protein